MTTPTKVVLFDGVCNMCDGFVNFVIDKDKTQSIHFASLQSDFGQNVLQKNRLDIKNFTTLIYLREQKLLVKSTAGLYILKDLGGFFSILFVFILFPEFFRNFFYDFIAKNRYKFFGKREACRMPTPELRARFL